MFGDGLIIVDTDVVKRRGPLLQTQTIFIAATAILCSACFGSRFARLGRTIT
jgi:hypothetical protein